MELTFSLKLPDALYRQLITACEECRCSPKQFAAECLESVLASRRMHKAEIVRKDAK